MHTPIPLPRELTRDGFTFKQVFRDGKFAIYRQTKPGTQIEAYEVIIINVRGQRHFQGKILPAAERYPISEDWGIYGWTYRNLPEAKEKLASLMLERNI